jgi:hypothetical protein
LSVGFDQEGGEPITETLKAALDALRASKSAAA